MLMRQGIFVLSLFILMFSGCQRPSARKTLSNYYSHEVVFPKSLDCVHGMTPQRYTLSDSVPKMVVFIDSTECTSCRIGKLIQYSQIETQALNTGKFMLVLIMSPKQKDYSFARHEVEIRGYPFDVYFDPLHEFRSHNSFISDDIRFHAFLTNASHFPVMVGDPSYGERLRSLFEQVIDSF